MRCGPICNFMLINKYITMSNNDVSQSSRILQTIVVPANRPSPNFATNLDTVQDFTNVCRTCATIAEYVVPIFSGEGLENNLADKLSRHLRIQVQENDELPQVLCYQCSSTLLAWHELKKFSKQADIALRAQIYSNQQKINQPNGKSNSSEEEEIQRKSKPESSRLDPQQYRTCVYCATTHSFASYRKHLDIEHSHRLFLCDECDSYIDKKDLILHLSFHAIHYKSQGKHRKKFKSMREENVSQNPNPVSPAPAPQCSPKTESPQSSLITESPQSSLKTESTDQTSEVINMVCIPDTEFLENEFSDHSDMDGFEPLPESVFEAIEDSQDSQHLQDNTTDTPENRPHNDDSKKSSQPEDNNLTSPAQSFEKNNKFNNSSVVIEPINRNNHAQMNIAIKDLGLPANKTPTKTAEASISDNHPSGKKEKKNGETRKCTVCPKEFRASSSYYYHLKYVHNDNKEHDCEVCGRKFNTRSCLTQHMAIHAVQYEFECQQCQKRFKTKASLYIHEQTHSGKKPFSCTQCKMTFRWNTQLLKHKKRHAAEKGHVCDTCGRGFSVRCDLLRHARTHTAGNFPCDKCGQKFAQMRYLKVHIAKQHSTNLRRNISK